MNINLVRSYCSNKAGTEEDFPFDEETVVIRVMSKIFLLGNISSDNFINVKCNPERAEELRQEYPDAILPGYHMNKKHWNSVYFNHGLTDSQIISHIDHSYDLIVASLSKKIKEELSKL